MKYASLKDNLNYIRALRQSRLEGLLAGTGETGLSDEEILAEVEYVRQIMYEERGGDENHSGYKSVD